MKSFFTALLLSAGCAPPVCAQMFFTPGYLVTATGDTVRGEIREKDNTNLGFRTGDGTAEQWYSPEQVTAYGTDGSVGRSATWSEDGTTRRVFLREIVGGHVSLLELIKPDPRLTYALRLPDQRYVPLRYSLALLNLTQHLTGCRDPQFRRLLTTQSFYNGRAYFERVVRAYNTCVSPERVDDRPRKTFSYEAGLLAGAARNTWVYGAVQERLSPYWNPNGVCSPAYAGVLGGFLTIAPRKRLSLTLEGLFSYYKGGRTVRINNPSDPADPSSRYYAFDEQYLAFPLAGRYVFRDRAVRWYVKGGAALSFGLSVRGQYSGGSILNADIPLRPGIGVGYLAGAGAEVSLRSKQRLYVELRTVPHLVLHRVTRMANSRSLQLTVAVPLVKR